MKKQVRVQDVEVSSFHGSPSSSNSGTPNGPGSARSSSSSNGEYEAILAMLAGPPLQHKPVLQKIPIVLVVCLMSALILLAPVLIVWGINMDSINKLSVERRDETLLHRAGALHDSIMSATRHCEKVITDIGEWVQVLPRTGNDYSYMINDTNFAWTMGNRDYRCGNATYLFLDNGSMFSAFMVARNLIRVQPCLSTHANCSTYTYVFNTTTNNLIIPPTPPRKGKAQSDLPVFMQQISLWGRMEQLNTLVPVWGQLQTSNFYVELFFPLKRNLSGHYPPILEDPINGLVKMDIKAADLVTALQDSEGDGIVGTYVLDGDLGYIVATTFNENATAGNNVSQTWQTTKIFRANESSIDIVLATYPRIPSNMSAGETKIIFVDGYPVAYTKLVTDYGLTATIVTIGDASYFNSFSESSKTASGAILAVAVVIGAAMVTMLALSVRVGLVSIRRAVNWLIEDQLDGSALMLRGEDGEFDKAAVERLRNANYKMSVYFSEMNAIGKSVEKLAANNRELKAFFPSMFVGLSKDEIKSGAHLTNLRFKNVAVMFVDIVRFSPICAQNEAHLDIILQAFFGILESPVFKKKGLTKRLGDGFMAAFGFSSQDNDFMELCKRCHECCRLIIKNLPKLNKNLRQHLPLFPETGIRLRIGISAGLASIGVVQTDAMSNADVYGGIINMGQRMEDSGRYKELNEETNTMVPWPIEEIPRSIVTVTPEVFQALDSRGELAKYGVEFNPVSVIIKGECEARLAYRCIEDMTQNLSNCNN